ncbi:MAG: TIR domain-containing protein [Longimicrobiales bacterium]
MFNEWDKLLYLMQQGECVVFLGPELPIAGGGTGLRSAADDLTERILSEVVRSEGESVGGPASLADAAHRLLRAEEGGEVALEMVVREWHSSLAEYRSELHDLLSDLPIRVIVCGSHDPLMEQALVRAGKTPQVRSYNYQGDFRDLGPEATESEPLLYHLFGHVSEPESLVLTEFALLDFLTSLISKTPALPNDVNQMLSSGRSFLFLGFGLRHWYLRILLHYLKILTRLDRQKNRGFAVAVEQEIAEGQAVLFYRDNYKFDLLDLDAIDFVRELSRRWSESPLARSVGSNGSVAASARTDRPARHRPDAPTVFVCHASEDAPLARRIHDALAAAHLNPWLDQADLRGGDDWNDRIETTIDEVDFFVVLHSRHLVAKATERSYVNKEIKLALDVEAMHGLGRFIIPARVDETEPDPRLRSFHFVDLTAEGGERALIRAIKREG